MIKKRLTKKEIKKINLLVNKGYSLNSISKILNKSKTTIYYHFKKIKGRTYTSIQINLTNEELTGEFIGLFAGDGCLNTTKDYRHRTFLCFNTKEEKYTNNLIENVLIVIFGKRPMIYRQEHRLYLFYYSKQIHNLIYQYLKWNKKYRKTYSVELKEKIHCQDFIKGFLRGCVDSDGYISQNKISFATVSPGLKNDISHFLNEMDISHSARLYREKRENRKDIYHISIKKKDYVNFLKIIKPRNINGDCMRRPGFEFLNAQSPRHCPDHRLSSMKRAKAPPKYGRPVS